ncbi:MAG: protein kinase [Deltaproteobacteria bacterium]|nr:protein kinase [Deltaproteobacteria bacterium]
MIAVETVGRYQFLRKLGSGGMAEVFLAKRAGAQGIDKLLVVKRVLPAFARNDRFIAMFVDEAKVAMRLNHPNIVQVYAFEEAGDDRLLAMEFVDGTDLAKLSSALGKARRRIAFPLAAYIAQESAKGLDYAHSRKDERGEAMEIVHRDVSPQNLLISYDGGVKVTDFGIAKARLVTDEEGVIKGKFAYMSPEQASGFAVDRRSDVWSLGVVLYEMLVGKSLFGAKAGMEALELIRNTDITHIEKAAPDVPEALAEIVMRALVRDREGRYQSAREMANALARFLHAQPEICDASTLEAFLAQALPRSPDPRAPIAAPVRPPPKAAVAEDVQIDTNAETLMGSTPVRPQRELRERQNVVVVAGELRGYDRLVTGSGSPVAHAALVELLRMLGDIAFKNDAMVGAADEGGFILFFGLDHSSVHDPLRAVRVGLDVLEALEGLSRDLPESTPLTLGVGVNRGQALCVREADGRLKRFEPQGPVIPVAEKLSQHAREGQLLVGGGVYRLARRDFNFEEGDQIPVPDETADGAPVPHRKSDTAPNAVRAYHFLSAKTREERMREAASEGGGLVGRELELRSLSETYREVVTSGKSSYLAVIGEMGIGKTSLLGAFLASLEPPGARVLRAECTFATLDVPFGCAMDLVRDACGIAAEDPTEVIRQKIDSEVRALFADAAVREREDTLRAFGLLFDVPLGDAPSVEAPEAAERYRITTLAVRRLLDRLARKAPVLPIIENVQWADRASLELLRELAKRSYPLPILGIVVARPDERLAFFLEGIARISLSELEREDRKRLIQDRLGSGEDTAELRGAILAKGGGNPFFIHEIIESLIDRDILAVDHDPSGKKTLRLRKKGTVALPTTLEGVIAARIDELPPEERMVLRWAAIAGSVFREKLIADLSGLDVSRELGRLVKRGLLDLGKRGEVRFRHAVVREVAYGGLDPADRARMHRKIGERLILEKSARGAGAARVARHLELAGDTLAAAKHYLEAADAARALYSNREALHFYQKASQLLPLASKDRFLAHERREQILRGLGRRREQLAELEAMRKIATAASDASQMALALNRLARFYVDVGRSENAGKAVQAALDVAQRSGDKGAQVEALRILAAVHRDVGEYARGIESCDKALETLGTGADALTQRGTVLIQKGILLRQTGRLRESLQTYAEALVIYRRLGIKRLQAQTLSNMGVASTSMGEYEDAIALYRQSLALDREIGDRYALGHRLANIGQAYGEMGERTRALSYLRKAVSVHEAFGDRSGMADALLTACEVLADAGDGKEAPETFARALALADTGGDTYDRARARVVGADLEMRAERAQDAQRLAEEGITIARAAGLRTFEAHALAVLADAQRAQGDRGAARESAGAAVEIAAAAGRLERAERIYFVQYRVLDELGDTLGAAVALTRADAEVRAKLERFRNPALRALYQALPLPRRIGEAIRKQSASREEPAVDA